MLFELIKKGHRFSSSLFIFLSQFNISSELMGDIIHTHLDVDAWTFVCNTSSHKDVAMHRREYVPIMTSFNSNA